MTVVSPIPARTVDGWDPVTIAPTSTPAADSWTFTVLAGDVTLAGSGATRTFTAPAVFAGTTVQVGVTSTSGGVTSPQRVATYTVRPWNSFILTGSATPTDIIDGGTGSTTAPDVVDGGTAGGPDTVDGGTSALSADTFDGGTASALSPDVIDGSPGSTSPDTVDGGTDAGLSWVPRRPIQLI